MSSQTVSQGAQGRSATEYMVLGANVLYAIAGLVFLFGLYVDWQQPGSAYVAPLVITAATETPNSGLFILSIIFLVLGFVLSKTGRYIEARNVEKVDQTQEWTVDVGQNKR